MTVVQLPTAIEDPVIAQHAAEIRRLGKRIIDDLIEIGRRLSEVRGRIGRGHWLDWLDREFAWSDDTARNYIRLYELSRTPEFRKFRNLKFTASSLFLLARATPEQRDAIAERTRLGERMTAEKIGNMLAANLAASVLLRNDMAEGAPSLNIAPATRLSDGDAQLLPRPGPDEQKPVGSAKRSVANKPTVGIDDRRFEMELLRAENAELKAELQMPKLRDRREEQIAFARTIKTLCALADAAGKRAGDFTSGSTHEQLITVIEFLCSVAEAPAKFRLQARIDELNSEIVGLKARIAELDGCRAETPPTTTAAPDSDITVEPKVGPPAPKSAPSSDDDILRQ